MRHLDLRWMNLIFSPPAPTTSFTLCTGICRVGREGGGIG